MVAKLSRMVHKRKRRRGDTNPGGETGTQAKGLA